MGIQEQGSHGDFRAGTEKRGVNPRRRNGTVRCMFFPIGAGAPVTRVKPGKALRKERAFAPRTESGYSVPIFSPAFPAERMRVHKNVCTKAKKWLWCFLFVRTAGVYTPILYGIKNDKL